MAYVVERVINECSTYVLTPENEGNITLEKPVTTTHERPNSPGAPGGTFTFAENDVIAKYIKVDGTYNSSNEGFHVKELRAYGDKYVAGTLKAAVLVIVKKRRQA